MKLNLPLIVLSISMIVGALFIDMFMPIRDSFIDAAAAAGTAAPEKTESKDSSLGDRIKGNPIAIFGIVVGGLMLVALLAFAFANRNRKVA